MRVAILDLGTNTFHLLIADIFEDAFAVVYKEKIPVKIGKGGINEGRITDAAFHRALEAIHAFHGIIENLHCNQVKATATSAIRSASNGSELLSKIKQQTGIEIRTISGNEEAELIFEGVIGAIEIGKEPVLVMDIGGGSVEFIIGNEFEIFWKKSYEIGAQRLVDKFHHTDPISSADLQSLFSYLNTQLHELMEKVQKYSIKTLIGCSGTFDTLSDIYCEENKITKNLGDSEVPFNIDNFDKIYQELISNNREARLRIPGMVEMRVDMIVVAVGLIKFLLNNHNFINIRVSTYALKEGLLFNLIHEHGQTTV